MIAIGYIRRSKKSETKTISLDEQRTQVEAYCQTQSFDLRAVVTHDGISGTKRSRLEEIDKIILSQGAGVLVVYHMDRLARDVAGLVDYLRALQKRGIEVHEVGVGKIDLTKSSGFILTAVKGAFDELFPIIISEKTKDALIRKKANGKRYSNLPPFGFRIEGDALAKENNEQAALSIIAGCRSKGLGARRTRKVLLESGYRGRMGVTTIHRLLHRKETVEI